MIWLSGKIPGEDIDITYTGLRPGEKLYEELFHDQEQMSSTCHEQIFLAHHRSINWKEVMAHMVRIDAAVADFDEQTLLDQICWFVPENGITRETPQAQLVS
jgi:FlaA1/EpsC-like NDP-sugar epimerase